MWIFWHPWGSWGWFIRGITKTVQLMWIQILFRLKSRKTGIALCLISRYTEEEMRRRIKMLIQKITILKKKNASTRDRTRNLLHERQRLYHWDTEAFLLMSWNIKYILTPAKDKSGSGPVLQSYQVFKRKTKISCRKNPIF